MEQIYVESNKVYHHGYVLKEQDIRRIIDLMNEQFKKLSADPVIYEYTMKFENGAVANTVDIETVLRQDNDGSSKIVRLEIKGEQVIDQKSSVIKIEFKNVDADGETGEGPIRHLIKGQSRDWVFVTSSLVEERMSKVKRRQMDPSSSKGSAKILYKLLTPLLMLAIMMSMLASTPNAIKEQTEKKDLAIAEIEKKWKDHKFTDPIEVMIELEKAKSLPDKQVTGMRLLTSMFLTTPFIVIIGIIVLLIILTVVFLKFYPACNFYWGNYMEVFDKKESTRKWIVGLVFGTIGLGIVINLLSNYIWQKI